MILRILLISTLILHSTITLANQACSRVAIINYQEILVDAGNNKKGEGLRYYFEKDDQALSLLNEYQDRNKPSTWSAASSTLGSFMIFSSLVQTGKPSGLQNRNTLLTGGAILIAISYFASKTVQRSNESLLNDAIDSYNKKNTPKIYFNPFGDGTNSGATLGIKQEF